MDLREQQREHFNQVAEQYRVARSNPNHLRFKKLLWDYALSSIQLPCKENCSVLEAMCGFADGYGILSSRYGSVDYSGFDYSEHIVAYLRDNHPQLDILHLDVTAFNADRQFDVVILLGGLHHVPNYAERVVANLAAGLKPGGMFINFEPTHGNALFRAVRERIYKKNALFDEDSERAFSVKELNAFFQNAGLEKEKIIYPGLLSYVLFYNPDAFPALNIGSTKLVSLLWAAEQPFMDTVVAKTLSFATLSIWRKP